MSLLKKTKRLECIKGIAHPYPGEWMPFPFDDLGDNDRPMTETPPKRRLSKGQIALMIAIDVVALVTALSLFFWLRPKDADAALLALIAPLVFGGFFNLVIVLVSLKP